MEKVHWPVQTGRIFLQTPVWNILLLSHRVCSRKPEMKGVPSPFCPLRNRAQLPVSLSYISNSGKPRGLEMIDETDIVLKILTLVPSDSSLSPLHEWRFDAIVANVFKW